MVNGRFILRIYQRDLGYSQPFHNMQDIPAYVANAANATLPIDEIWKLQ